MANETAALVVALSAQVSKFQKDMDAANGIATKTINEIQNRFAAAGGVIASRFGSEIQGAASRLGTIGAAMSALGPIGLVAAAGIGALALAFDFVTEKTEIFVEKAKNLKNMAEDTGLTVTQLRLLIEASKKVGVETEEAEKFIKRLAISLTELKDKGAEAGVFGALLKIDSGLVRDISSTKELADQIDILAKAFRGLTDQGQRLALLRTIGGRGSLGVGRLLDTIADQGGLAKLDEEAKALGKTLDKEVIDKLVEQARRIEEIKKKTDGIYGKLYAKETLDAQEASAKFWLEIAQNVERTARAAPTVGGLFNQMGEILGDQKVTNDIADTRNRDIEAKLLEHGRRRLEEIEKARTGQVSGVPVPASRPESAPVSAAVELGLMRKWTSIMGDAITPTEALRQKILELNVAQEQAPGEVTAERRARAEKAFRDAQSAAALATRESLGIAREDEIVKQKLIELEDKRAKGMVRSAEEIATAEKIIAREAKASTEAQLIRQSQTPEFTRNMLEAANAMKQFDQIVSGSLNSTADAFADVVTGTKNLKDAVHDLINSLSRDLARSAFKSLVASLIPGGAGSNVFGNLFSLGRNASGTDYWRGGATWVGENGPEIVNLPKGSQVIPANIARNADSGGVTVQIVNHVDATGADMAAVQRLHAGLAAVNRSVESRAVAALRSHRMLAA